MYLKTVIFTLAGATLGLGYVANIAHLCSTTPKYVVKIQSGAVPTIIRLSEFVPDGPIAKGRRHSNGVPVNIPLSAIQSVDFPQQSANYIARCKNG